MAKTTKTIKNNLRIIDEWSKDIFKFTEEVLNMKPSEPINKLRGKAIKYKDSFGNDKSAILFDIDGRLVYPDLSFYSIDMFKHQRKTSFRNLYKGKRFTWQQTVELEAYNRAIETFGKDSFDMRKRWITITSGHGIGKCLGYDTDILMNDGTIKKVQNVVVGDKLMGEDNTPRNVLSLARGQEQMYRIKYKDGTYYDVNESHILSLVATQTHGIQKKGDITNVAVRDYLLWSDRKKRTNIGYKRSIELPKKQLLIDPYLLGLWLGDGSSSSGYIFNVDKEIKEYLRDIGIGKERIDPRTGCWQATVLGLKEKLRDIGVLFDKHIPTDYLISSKQQRLELLAGLIDTDGSLDKSKRQFDFIQKNKRLAEQTKWLAQSVGMHATIKEVQKSSQNGTVGIYHRVNISRNTELIPTKVERKRATTKGNEQRANLHFSFSVEKLGVDNYYGFEIDGNKLFMLGEFTVTHNTSFLSVVSLHFLICYFSSQIRVTANTEQQLKDIFLKELYFWRKRMPEYLRDNLEMLDDMVRVKGNKDWFLKAIVSRKEKPEALAGLHGKHILILVDEASGIADIIFEVMKGALTGQKFIVIYTSNPTRNEGEFYESHKKGAEFTQLHFNSRHSPIVEDGYIKRMEDDYGKDSDEIKVRVDGLFSGENEMDEKGWIPLFSNLTILFEPERGQIINKAIIGIDPAGKGRDRSIIAVRDNIYLKEVLDERTSSEKDLARKVETIRDIYNSSSNDIGIDAFGIGAKVLANINTKLGENVNAILTDKPKEDTKDLYHTYRSELAWKFRDWVANGGIIITNNKKSWLNELEKIKYKRDMQGRIMIMNKVEFKKEYRFSPDKFDCAIYTFFKDEPTRPVILTKAQLETKDMIDFMNRVSQKKQDFIDDIDQYSSM